MTTSDDNIIKLELAHNAKEAVQNDNRQFYGVNLQSISPTLQIAAESFQEANKEFQYEILSEPRYLNLITADDYRATLMVILAKEPIKADVHHRRIVMCFDLMFEEKKERPGQSPSEYRSDIPVTRYVGVGIFRNFSVTPAQMSSFILQNALGDYIKSLLSRKLVINETALSTAAPGRADPLQVRFGRFNLQEDIQIYLHAMNLTGVLLDMQIESLNLKNYIDKHLHGINDDFFEASAEASDRLRAVLDDHINFYEKNIKELETFTSLFHFSNFYTIFEDAIKKGDPS